jgi:molybdopterin-guanine dinucleotide biosynthesis protein A
MGEDKAFAPFQGRTLLEWMRDKLSPLFPHVFVVVRDPFRFHDMGLPVVSDALPEVGSAVGVYTAVLAAPTERVICVACDMPFVTPRLLWELADRSEGFDVFVPRHGDYMQPLCAVYSKRTLDAYREFIASGGRRIFDIYPDLNTGYLDMDDGRWGDPEQLFLNVNTPAELEAARQRIAGEDAGWRAALQPRIQAFMDASPLPVVSFIGKKKSGKTTVLVPSGSRAAYRGGPHDTPMGSRSTCPVPIPMVPPAGRCRSASLAWKYVWLNTPEERFWASWSGRSENRWTCHHRGLQEAGCSKIEVSREPGAQSW